MGTLLITSPYSFTVRAHDNMEFTRKMANVIKEIFLNVLLSPRSLGTAKMAMASI